LTAAANSRKDACVSKSTYLVHNLGILRGSVKLLLAIPACGACRGHIRIIPEKGLKKGVFGVYFWFDRGVGKG
jgi:hypothetical protein